MGFYRRRGQGRGGRRARWDVSVHVLMLGIVGDVGVMVGDDDVDGWVPLVNVKGRESGVLAGLQPGWLARLVLYFFDFLFLFSYFIPLLLLPFSNEFEHSFQS